MLFLHLQWNEWKFENVEKVANTFWFVLPMPFSLIDNEDRDNSPAPFFPLGSQIQISLNLSHHKVKQPAFLPHSKSFPHN